MEPDELYLLENGPDQFKLTLSGSELQEQSLCFQKSRTTYRMAYLAEGVWADHKELLMSSELRLQQLGEKENPGCKSVGHQVLQCATKRLCLRIMGYVVSYFPGHRQSIGPAIQAGTNKQNQSIFLESWTSLIH